MRNSDEKLTTMIESAKSRRSTVRITLTLFAGTWREIERLMTMFGMKQREVFDLCYSLYSKFVVPWAIDGDAKETEGQVKKTVVISERFNRFLVKESKKVGRSKSELVSFMVHLLLEVAVKHREEVMEKVKRSVSIMDKIVKEIDKADVQLRKIWGDEEWEKINSEALSTFTESAVIVDNFISDLQAMALKLDK